MYVLDISKFHPKGKEYELFETLDELNIGQWEQIMTWTLKEDADLSEMLNEVYKIPKNQLRMIPRVMMDVVETNYNITLGEALEIHEAQEIIEGVSFDTMPWYKWLDITDMAQAHNENPATFTKYLLAITYGDYDNEKEGDLDRVAEEMKERPAVEGLRLAAFFIVKDPKFRNLINQYIPQMTSWLPPIPEATGSN